MSDAIIRIMASHRSILGARLKNDHQIIMPNPIINPPKILTIRAPGIIMGII